MMLELCALKKVLPNFSFVDKREAAILKLHVCISETAEFHHYSQLFPLISCCMDSIPLYMHVFSIWRETNRLLTNVFT